MSSSGIFLIAFSQGFSIESLNIQGVTYGLAAGLTYALFTTISKRILAVLRVRGRLLRIFLRIVVSGFVCFWIKSSARSAFLVAASSIGQRALMRGGDVPSIIPDHTVAGMFARADDIVYLDEVVQRVKKCIEGAAIATGCTFKVRTYANRYENMVTNLSLAEAIQNNWEKNSCKS